jgi:hypothetical protein
VSLDEPSSRFTMRLMLSAAAQTFGGSDTASRARKSQRERTIFCDRTNFVG